MKEPLSISQSMVKDFESMCPIAFNAKWSFEGDEEDNPWYIGEKQAIRFGVHFETLAIGSGMGGKTISWTDKEKSSVYHDRIKAQAKVCRDYLKALGGKIKSTQKFVQAEFEHQGITIKIQGNWDVEYEFKDGTGAVIDLKSTGDLKNSFGKFQWSNAEKIDITQLIQYRLLYYLNKGTWPRTIFLVFDLSAEEKFVPYEVEISEQTIDEYKDRLLQVYSDISNAMTLDYWEPKPSFMECKICPLKDNCRYQQKYPEFVLISK